MARRQVLGPAVCLGCVEREDVGRVLMAALGDKAIFVVTVGDEAAQAIMVKQDTLQGDLMYEGIQDLAMPEMVRSRWGMHACARVALLPCR